MKATATIDVSKLVAGLTTLSAKADRVIRSRAGKAGLQLMNDAIMEPPTAPIKQGHLRGSASVLLDGKMIATGASIPASGAAGGTPSGDDSSMASPGRVRVVVGFNTAYAAHLHEHPEYQFTDPMSGGKYLEKKQVAHAVEYVQYVATGLKGLLETGQET